MTQKKGVYPNGDYPFAPSAPPPSILNNEIPSYIPDRPPPPSYEESQKQYSNAQCNNNVPSAPFATSGYIPKSSDVNVGYPQMNQGYGHVPISQSQYSSSIIPRPIQQNIQQPSGNKSIHVVQYSAGTRFSGKGGGSISVPPPPPGVAPNPAQIAALQGQPVILQKKKKPFF